MPAKTGDGRDGLGSFLIRALEIVRVYTKMPGKPADTDKPFTVRRGGAVLDVARLVQKDIARDSTVRMAEKWIVAPAGLWVIIKYYRVFSLLRRQLDWRFS